MRTDIGHWRIEYGEPAPVPLYPRGTEKIGLPRNLRRANRLCPRQPFPTTLLVLHPPGQAYQTDGRDNWWMGAMASELPVYEPLVAEAVGAYWSARQGQAERS